MKAVSSFYQIFKISQKRPNMSFMQSNIQHSPVQKHKKLILHSSSQPVSSKGIVSTAFYHGNNLCAVHAIGQLIYPTISYFSFICGIWVSTKYSSRAPRVYVCECVYVWAVSGHDRAGNCVGSSKRAQLVKVIRWDRSLEGKRCSFTGEGKKRLSRCVSVWSYSLLYSLRCVSLQHRYQSMT